MQTRPLNWATLFDGAHITEYKYVINGVDYLSTDVQGTPIITKPLMDQPCIGQCSSGSITITVRKKSGVTIPKAATVVAYCRLISRDGRTTTVWVEQGHYRISRRKATGDLIALICFDSMGKAGAKYIDVTAITEWPVTMSTVVNEIASVMGVSIDPRTVIRTGADYVVSYPNDLLMSEVLGMIGAAHCGNWMMTETDKLRLVPVFSTDDTVSQAIGSTFKKYHPISLEQSITRITLTDDAGNNWTVGNDAGKELTAECDYATQAMVSDNAKGYYVQNGTLCGVTDGSVTGSTVQINDGTIASGALSLPSKTVDNIFQPYQLSGAYIDPLLELGDTVSIMYKGSAIRLFLAAMTIRCNQSFNADVSYEMELDDEDEYPYSTPAEQKAARSVTTGKSYFGNKINRQLGFTSELVTDDVAVSRLIANASTFSMQQNVSGGWEDRIYFDAANGKYRITGEVEIEGRVTFTDLSTSGSTIINGDNITTGKIRSTNGDLEIDLDAGTLTVNGQDLSDVVDTVENRVTLLATAQVFTKAAGATAYLPASITLTADTEGTLVSFQWYKDEVAISGATSDTLTVAPADITGNASTYKVMCRDAHNTAYTDLITIAKLADGEDGEPGQPGQKGDDGIDGYTVVLSNEYIEVPVNAERKPNTGASYVCTVTVYKGVTALTPTTAAVIGENEFKLNKTGGITGVTIAMGANSVTLTTTTANAIPDSAQITLTAEVYGGLSISKMLTMQANMNAVVVTHDSSITTLNDQITLKVSETTYHAGVPVLSSTPPSDGWTDAQKAAYIGYLWQSTGNKKVFRWTGVGWEVSDGTNSWATYSSTMLDMTANRISWVVASGTSSSDFTLTDRAMTLATSTITLTASDSSNTAYSGTFTISAVSGATYGFALGADGYYCSTNAGVDSSYSICKVTVNNTTATTRVLTLACINYAENNYDYGVIGKMDTELSTSITDDPSVIFKSFYGLTSASAVNVSVPIPAGSHYFYIKFRKDGSSSIYGDYFKFKQVADSGASSVLTIKAGDTTLSSAAISFTGFVTFNDLAGNGTTTINGNNITTGIIAAARLDVDNLYVKHLSYGTDGYFSGSLTAASGTFTGELVAASGTFTGSLQAVSGTFSTLSTIDQSSGYGMQLYWSSIIFRKDWGSTWSGQIDVDSLYGIRIWSSHDVAILGNQSAYNMKFACSSVGTNDLSLVPTAAGKCNIGTGTWYFDYVQAVHHVTKSTRKIKDNIITAENFYSSIDNLRPVTFTMKTDPTAQTQLGFIAEEVMEVCPMLVDLDENGEASGLDYSRFVVLLVDEVQKLRARVASLEEKTA